MANTSIREQLRDKVSNLMTDLMLETGVLKSDTKADVIEQGKKFIHAHNSRLNEILNLIATHYTPTADVAELIRAARVEEKRIIYLALAKLTLDSKDSYYLGRDLLNYMKKHGYELATAQPPHKAEHIDRGNGFTHSEDDDCDDVDKADQ